MVVRRDPSHLKGSIVPLVTPFHSDGSIDETALTTLIHWQSESGNHGISVTGTTGEPASLPLDEREYVMDIASRAIKGRVSFIPDTGTNNLKETLRLPLCVPSSENQAKPETVLNSYGKSVKKERAQ